MTAARRRAGSIPEHRPSRVAIERVRPEIDGGRFPIKRVVGEEVEVTASIHADGHDVLGAVLLHRPAGNEGWSEVRMEALPGDRWRGSFTVTTLGTHEYGVCAWVDRFATWSRDLGKRFGAGQDVDPELAQGAAWIEEAATRAPEGEARKLRAWAREIRPGSGLGAPERVTLALDLGRAGWMERYDERRDPCTYERVLRVTVDRERARFATWYEMFPRSAALEPGRHGTFRDVEARLPHVASMGFDVLYLPPIHPIGVAHRKGRNGTTEAAPGDPGSPWAIGSPEGGHRSIHPSLGKIEDFRRLLRAARGQGIEIALDIAFQCSPDHPWVREHPAWFRHRPDGTIRYAENPPKRYEDIFPLDFETEEWTSLWEELLGVISFWIGEGVRIFRVDNPHTKPYAFWEWCIGKVRETHPDVIFLSEAFTRPSVMYRLAKLGFHQSYTYFAWRNTAAEIRDYFTELTATEVREYFRPSLWPNTPDILTEYLQAGGRPAHLVRLVLAATLGASYGIYGPAFELCAGEPREPGGEEYADSEKYRVAQWNLDDPRSLREVIARINRIRRESPALQSDRGLRFYPTTNDRILLYGKQSPDRADLVLVAVNLDPHHRHSCWAELPLQELGLDPGQPYQLHDLVTGARYIWQGPRNYLDVDPAVFPAHILRVRRRMRTEQDFDYYL